MLFAYGYRFNCGCKTCQIEVLDHPHVLQCRGCSGPVVPLLSLRQLINADFGGSLSAEKMKNIPNSYSGASCMLCQRKYIGSSHRMLRVSKQRANFKQLWRYFSQPSVLYQKNPLENQTFVKNLELLTDSIDYQITYLYGYNQDLQHNLMLYCWLLLRIGKFSQACLYGLYGVKEDLTEQHSNSPRTAFQNLKFSAFFLQLYSSYVANYCELSDEEKILDGESPSLLDIAKRMIKHFEAKLALNVEDFKLQVSEHGYSMDKPVQMNPKLMLELLRS